MKKDVEKEEQRAIRESKANKNSDNDDNMDEKEEEEGSEEVDSSVGEESSSPVVSRPPIGLPCRNQNKKTSTNSSGSSSDSLDSS